MKNIGYQNNSEPIKLYCPSCRIITPFNFCIERNCESLFRCLDLALKGILNYTTRDQNDTNNEDSEPNPE